MEAKLNVPLASNAQMRQSLMMDHDDQSKFESEENASTCSSVSSLKSKLSQLRSCLSTQFIRESRELEEDIEIVKTLEKSRESLSHLCQLVNKLTIRSHNSGQKEASHHQFYSEIRSEEERVLNVSVMSICCDTDSNKSQIEHDDPEWAEHEMQGTEDSKHPAHPDIAGKSFLSHLKQSVKNLGERLKIQKQNPTPKPQERKERPPKMTNIMKNKLKIQRVSQTNLSATQGNISRGFSRENTMNQSQRMAGGALALSMLEARNAADTSSQIFDQANAQTPKGRIPKTVRQKLQDVVQHRAVTDTKASAASKLQSMTERMNQAANFPVKAEWSYSNQHLENSGYGIQHPESSQTSLGLRKVVNILPKASIPRVNVSWGSHLEGEAFRTADPQLNPARAEARLAHGGNAIGYEDVRRTSSPESFCNSGSKYQPKTGIQQLMQDYITTNQAVASTNMNPDRQRVPRNSTRVLYPNMMAVQNSPEFAGHSGNAGQIERRSDSREFDGIYLRPSADPLSKRMKFVQSFLLPALTPEDSDYSRDGRNQQSQTDASAQLTRSALFGGRNNVQTRVADNAYLDSLRQEINPVSTASSKTLSNRMSAISSAQPTPNANSPVLGKMSRK